MSIEAIPVEASEEPTSPWEGRTQAESELGWYYRESGGALGERSAWSSLVMMAMVGGHAGTRLEPYVDGEVTCPLPGRGQIQAAARCKRIKLGLQQCTKQSQAVLEHKFSIRRKDAQVAGLLAQRDKEHLEPIVTYLVRTGQAKLKMDGSGAELDALIEYAEKLYETAIDEYETARGFRKREVSEVRMRSRPVPVTKRQAGEQGASKRRLVPVEAPRRARP